jgi:hypothetical protein
MGANLSAAEAFDAACRSAAPWVPATAVLQVLPGGWTVGGWLRPVLIGATVLAGRAWQTLLATSSSSMCSSNGRCSS